MGFLKKMPTSTIILILFAVFFAVWGAFQTSLSKQWENFSFIDIKNGIFSNENEEKNLCVTGKLEIEEQPTDDQTGFTADSVALIRTVEMYQYYISGDEVCMGFLTEQKRDITGKNGESYKNPSFPDGVKNKVFFAKAKIGDIVVGEEFLNELVKSNIKTVDGTTAKEVERKYLEDISLVDYEPCGDGYFKSINPQKYESGGLRSKDDSSTSSNSDKYKIGDIRVRFEYIDMDALGELSICGYQKDGKLIPDESTFNGVFYSTSVDEIENYYVKSDDYKSAGAVFFVIAGAMTLAAVLIFASKSRKGA